jgi:hypothetical protein
VISHPASNRDLPVGFSATGTATAAASILGAVHPPEVQTWARKYLNNLADQPQEER